MTTEIYSNIPELFEVLPDPKVINVVRFLGGFISHDICPPSQSEGSKLNGMVLKKGSARSQYYNSDLVCGVL